MRIMISAANATVPIPTKADIKLSDGDKIGDLGVLHTPGHTMDTDPL